MCPTLLATADEGDRTIGVFQSRDVHFRALLGVKQISRFYEYMA